MMKKNTNSQSMEKKSDENYLFPKKILQVTESQAFSDVISKWSAKKRALHLINDFARSGMTGKGKLSEEEFELLLDSFIKPAEIKIYERMKNAEESLRTFIPYLTQLRMGYAETIAKINGFQLVLQGYSQAEQIINHLLQFIHPDEQRQTAIQDIEKMSLPYSDICKKDEQTISVTLSKQHSEKSIVSIKPMLESLKKLAKKQLIEIKTAVQLARDYMSETEAEIEVYNSEIDKAENWAKNAHEHWLPSKESLQHKHYLEYDKIEINSEFYNLVKQAVFTHEESTTSF